ncbi:hypothetical protein DICVIV_14501 [Dictyocaulus viviparus]|uniref:glucuronosyltransferase n=1 Tax=Dictyocaulus viviparus TaxID=29172 RepID=A0A0D8X4Z6_DICVI|nr:hypothetical protein DICVIV_14501 [Dictyocaulus viviparus]
MSVKGDRMDIVERFMNMANVILGKILFSQTFIREINVFRAKFGAQFKDYNELIAKSSFIFTNSNPYLDYPRPTIHKTVSIGGITIDVKQKINKLPEKWNAVLNERNTTVLVSFGSVAKSIFMPDKYKSIQNYAGYYVHLEI